MTPGWPGRAARKRDLGGGCGTWPAGCPGERRSPRRRWPSASRPSGGLGRTPSRLGLVVAVHALDALRALGQQAAALGASLGQRPLVHGEVALRIAVAAVEHAPTPAPGPLDDQLARRLPSLLLALRAGDPGLLLLALHVPAFGVPRASDERSVPTVPLHEVAGRVEDLDPPHLSFRHVVQLLLHPGGEVIVDDLREVLDEEVDDDEGHVLGEQPALLDVDVFPVLEVRD